MMEEQEFEKEAERLGGVYWIIAWDGKGKQYLFETSRKKLQGEGPDGIKHAERLKSCDLSRYPVGGESGFNNKVVCFRTVTEERRPYSCSANRASEIYRTGGIEVQRGGEAGVRVKAEVLSET